MPVFCANLSFLFHEVPFPERFSLAAGAGFRGVEYMFPYDWPAAQVRDWLDRYRLVQVLHNLPAGDWAGADLPSPSALEPLGRGARASGGQM